MHNLEEGYDDVGRGPAIILLHGYPFNRSMWREQTDFLSAHSYRVVAPQLIGLSDKLQLVAASNERESEHHRQAEAYPTITTMEEMARDVCTLMDDLSLDQAVICGLSMGAYVAFEFVHLFPSRVRALVLAGARAQGVDEAEKKSREEQARRILIDGMVFVADAMLPKILPERTLKEKREIVSRVGEMILQTEPRAAAAAQRGMAARRDYASDLPDIDAPTLIIAGREDKIRTPNDAEFIHRGIKNSRVEIIDEAGHLMNMERAQVFNQMILSFLSNVRTSTAQVTSL